MLPNTTKGIGQLSAVLEAYLRFNGALAGGLLDPKIREQTGPCDGPAESLRLPPSAHTGYRQAGRSEARNR